jgi:hypothetical protein
MSINCTNCLKIILVLFHDVIRWFVSVIVGQLGSFSWSYSYLSLIWRHNNGGYPVLMGTYTILPQIRLFQRYLFYFLPTVTTRSFLHWFLAISFLRYEYDQEKLPNCPTITETNHLMTSWNKTKIILRQLGICGSIVYVPINTG